MREPIVAKQRRHTVVDNIPKRSVTFLRAAEDVEAIREGDRELFASGAECRLAFLARRTGSGGLSCGPGAFDWIVEIAAALDEPVVVDHYRGKCVSELGCGCEMDGVERT